MAVAVIDTPCEQAMLPTLGAFDLSHPVVLEQVVTLLMASHEQAVCYVGQV